MHLSQHCPTPDSVASMQQWGLLKCSWCASRESCILHTVGVSPLPASITPISVNGSLSMCIQGKRKPKVIRVCIRNHHILFFLSFLPYSYMKKKSMKWKVLWEGLKKEKLPGQLGTLWDPTAQPKILTLVFSPSLFLHVFGPSLRLSSMGTRPGPYGENQLFRPSASWLELRGGPHYEMMSSPLL